MTMFPGTTIETTSITKGSSRSLFEGIFATGGITLSQVSLMTGLEPYLIQNWVKRGFVSSPVKRLYSKQQFARIIIINMLREALKIEKICNLIKVIVGDLHDKNDDLISDDELYHRYVDMLSNNTVNLTDEKSVLSVAKEAAATYDEKIPRAREKLEYILQVMLYAHAASRLRDKSEEILLMID